jgi:transcriptional regulator of acetoin/glycerol metabolism
VILIGAAVQSRLHLEERLRRGELRRDLYARLAAFVIELPPLRDRRRDILPLAQRFLAEAAPGRRLTLGAAAAELLVRHAWPMNVRELKLVMRRLSLLVDGDARVDRPQLEHLLLPDPSAGLGAPRDAGRGVPAGLELEALLQAHRGSVPRVAAQVGRSVRQIYRWIERHGLRLEDFR